MKRQYVPTLRLNAANDGACAVLNRLRLDAEQGQDITNSGIWFRAAATGLWYQCRESAGDIDAWKEDGILHVLDAEQNGEQP